MHGVSPAISADAGSTGADKRMDESASAAENALSDVAAGCSEVEAAADVLWLGELAEHMIVAARGFVLNSFWVAIAVERFVGIVRDILMDFWLCFFGG